METINPCPFCGEGAALSRKEDCVTVACLICWAAGPPKWWGHYQDREDTEHAAIVAWNNRSGGWAEMDEDITENEFWQRVNKQGEYIEELNSRCWEWTGPRARGYGKHRLRQAHRVSWRLTRGRIPKKTSDGRRVCVLHHCDNRLCVNPDHLYLGTQSENMRDMYKRGGRKERRKGVKLTAQNVKDIRERYSNGDITQAELGRQYNVNRSVIHKIVHNDIWVGLE